MKTVLSLISMIALWCMIAVPASAGTTTFAKPKVGADRLDLCLNWGTGCGKPAADAWCQSKGYNYSVGHVVDPDIGAVTRTRLISTGAVCDQAFCDGFKTITCFKPTPVTKTFWHPKWGSDRLDWCLNWGSACGKPAADKYCQSKGYAKAISFPIDPDIGAVHRTRLISTGAVCDQAFCDGFKQITCSN